MSHDEEEEKEGDEPTFKLGVDEAIPEDDLLVFEDDDGPYDPDNDFH